MANTFLALTNRVLKEFNEAVLTSGTFADPAGFHANVKDYVNAAIVDIYLEENTEWPFAWREQTFDTIIGSQNYDKDATAISVDWDSFRISKPEVTVSSLTQAAGTASATTATAHYLVVGDQVYIRGATQTDYNGHFQVLTVADTTHFTFAVASTATSPATGTILCFPPFAEKKLTLINYDGYRKNYLEYDRNTVATSSFEIPTKVVRLLDNNILLSSKPDRVYPVVYEGFFIPDFLVDYDDEPEIPSIFQQAIIDKALYYGYMFRDNPEEAELREDKYNAYVNKLRRALIPIEGYMRHS
jgi:hypothetical protein